MPIKPARVVAPVINDTALQVPILHYDSIKLNTIIILYRKRLEDSRVNWGEFFNKRPAIHVFLSAQPSEYA
jgi:hypothetical protein